MRARLSGCWEKKRALPGQIKLADVVFTGHTPTIDLELPTITLDADDFADGAGAGAAKGAFTDDIFENYAPQRLKIPGAKPHPGLLVQSAAMAAVNPPAPTYTPNLPKAVITIVLLSNAQLEAVMYSRAGRRRSVGPPSPCIPHHPAPSIERFASRSAGRQAGCAMPRGHIIRGRSSFPTAGPLSERFANTFGNPFDTLSIGFAYPSDRAKTALWHGRHRLCPVNQGAISASAIEPEPTSNLHCAWPRHSPLIARYLFTLHGTFVLVSEADNALALPSFVWLASLRLAAR